MTLTRVVARLVSDAAIEVRHLAAPMQVTLRPETVIQITGLLQLALRHPALDPVHDRVARHFIDGARAYFADCPAVLDLIERGFDPGEDR
jgi:hypothetical protein